MVCLHGCELAVFEICLHSLAVYLGIAMSERLVCSAAVGRADAFSEPKEGSDGVLTIRCLVGLFQTLSRAYFYTSGPTDNR